MRIVFGALAEWVEAGARETGVQSAGGEAFVVLEGFLEFAAADTEVGLEQIGDRQAGVLVQLFRDGLLFFGADVGSLAKGMRVGAHGEVFHFFQEWLQGRRLRGKLLVIPAGGGVGGQGENVGQVNAGVEAGTVDVGGEVEDL